MARPVIVVGAGMAGLTCARALHRAGVEVLVLERDERIGGRMQSDVVDGFMLDRGFQHRFSGYPVSTSEFPIDYEAWAPMEMGALVRCDGRLRRIHRGEPLEFAFTKLLGFPDKLRLGSLVGELANMKEADIWKTPDTDTETFLLRYGFSEAFLERFARPLIGSMFLDRRLGVSWRMTCFTLKSMLCGEMLAPTKGISTWPDAIAAELPAKAIRTSTGVAGLMRSGSKVSGVQLDDGTSLDAEAVVVATDANAAASLCQAPLDRSYKGLTAVYYSIPEPLVHGNFLVFNGSGEGIVQFVVPVSNYAPERVPDDSHLICVTVLGVDYASDSQLSYMVQSELHEWFPKSFAQKWRLLRIYRLAKAQLDMPPGFFDALPTNRLGGGLYVAGEYTCQGSVEGAVRSGLACAGQVLGEVREPLSA